MGPIDWDAVAQRVDAEIKRRDWSRSAFAGKLDRAVSRPAVVMFLNRKSFSLSAGAVVAYARALGWSVPRLLGQAAGDNDLEARLSAIEAMLAPARKKV